MPSFAMMKWWVIKVVSGIVTRYLRYGKNINLIQLPIIAVNGNH